MKPFNLEEAINGKAFYLENGYRGVIKYCVDDYITQFEQPPNYPYVGYVLDNKGFLFTAHTAWNEHGGSNEYPSFNATTMVDDTLPQEKEQTMKPFDLEKALAGEPVVLRGGQKAAILYRISDKYKSTEGYPPAFPLQGLILDTEGFVEVFGACWRANGTYNHADSLYDIVGMWEEPVKPQEKILEDAWRNKGKVVKTDAGMTTTVEVVGKAADGGYIVHNPVDGLLAPIDAYGKLNWRPYEEPKGNVCNPKVATLHLPKPIKPKQDEDYWYIDKNETGGLCIAHGRYSYTWSYDRARSRQGNCFSSESDAKAWIDALNFARTGEITIC